MKVSALLIGINYENTSSELRGCINDVNNVRKFLVDKLGIKQENMRIMTDKSSSYLQPTGKNMRTGFSWLVEESKVSDMVFIHYSGHGSHTRDRDGDEVDGEDELLVPLDYPRDYIKDDEIHSSLVSKVQCPMFMLFDCCHSGTGADLLYKLDNKRHFVKSGKKDSNPNILKCMISGCMDTQTSADAYISGDYSGAMTWSFLTAMSKYRDNNFSYIQLIEGMRKCLNDRRYKQIPQFSTNQTTIDIYSDFMFKSIANSSQSITSSNSSTQIFPTCTPTTSSTHTPTPIPPAPTYSYCAPQSQQETTDISVTSTVGEYISYSKYKELKGKYDALASKVSNLEFENKNTSRKLTELRKRFGNMIQLIDG